MTVEITVRFAGELRTLAGQSSLDLSLEDGATLGEGLLALRDLVSPSFTEQVVLPLTAGEPSLGWLLLNRAHCSGAASMGRRLFSGDVVAFVTPIEGG